VHRVFHPEGRWLCRATGERFDVVVSRTTALQGNEVTALRHVALMLGGEFVGQNRMEATARVGPRIGHGMPGLTVRDLEHALRQLLG
jgi:hypothetical protein